MRSDWDTYFMNIATEISKRATCDRLHVGCVLVKDNQIIATGYNGSIQNHDHCDDIGHLIHEGSCKRTVHAEMNAIFQCAKYGVSCKGAICYVTDYPCPDCMKALNQVGIKKIVYKRYYPHRYENNFDKGLEIVAYDQKDLEKYNV